MPRPGGAEIGNLGLFVHLTADSVADVFPDDPDPVALADGLNRRADTSPKRLPALTWRIPAHIPASVAAMRRAASGLISPIPMVKAASP